jgi:uncharacterized RDD family membrane protein YckC
MASEVGYLSERDKQRFTIVAGVLGFVFFVLQFAVPMVAMFATMPFFGTGVEIVTFDRAGMAWRDGRLYAVEVTQSGSFSQIERHERLVETGPRGLEPVADLGDWQPSLLAVPAGLYLISSSAVATLEPGGVVDKVEPERPLGDISRPFVYEGEPAVVETRPDGRRLLVWAGSSWSERASYPVSASSECSQYLAPTGALLELQCQGTSLFARDLDREDGSWALVASDASRWWSFEMDGGPAVVVTGTNGRLRLLAPRGSAWTEVRSAHGLGAFVDQATAFQQTPGGPVTVASTGMPGSLRIGEWRESGLTETFRAKGSFPFPGKMFGFLWLAQLSPVLLSLVLAVVLSALMRAHRVREYEHAGRRVEFASLTRRALAQIVDSLFFAGPAIFFMARTFGDFEDFFESPGDFAAIFVWLGAALAWSIVLFLIFGLTEGRRGVTPGKWLTGIRVVGADLEPCGFGRALVRNLLKVVDGFFNFLVGLLLVAFTPDWQRLGDLAARTVVVRTGRRGLASLSPPTGA